MRYLVQSVVMTFLIGLVAFPLTASGQASPSLPDTGVRARARALCGPLADDSLLKPAGSLVSGAVPGLKLPTMLPNHSVLLEYPDRLRKQGIEGRVVTVAIIDTTGRVEPGSVELALTPDSGFAPPVRRYLERSRFTVGSLYERAMRVCVVLPIDFKVP